MTRLERQDHLFTLHLGDDENRITLAVIQELEGRLDEVLQSAGDGPAALIVAADGKYWSTGIDLEALSAAPAAEQEAFLPALNRLLGRILCFPVPTVAALNGHVFAGGALMALAMDYRVMRTGRGWFCLPEIDIQVPFHPAMTSLLRAKLSPRVLRDAVLTGHRYTAEEALAAGIVDHDCTVTDLPAQAAATISPLAEKARPAYAKFKRDLYGELAHELGYQA
ncbi:MAG: enoyl-CoA hydratase/isomerase family protein [Myxococcales bacterium]|jgi:enoyl-CoA hydratase/carnithine racemase